MATTLPPSAAASTADPSRALRAGYAALATNVGIVFTGGIVRITGSGLGCAEWPRCEPDSFVPTGPVLTDLHAAIEFGNRLLTFLVLAATLWFLWEVRRHGGLAPLVRRIASILPLGVLVQAVIGGITVLTGLRWWTVSVHFLASMVLIALAVAAVQALRADPSEPAAPRGLRHATTAITSIAFFVLMLGTFVTAAGPHGGDVDAPRIGIDIRVLSIAHADGVWLLLGTIGATLLLARHLGQPRLTRALTVLLVVSLAQGGVGYLQYWLGIPRELVSLHIVGALLVWLAASRVWVVAHRPEQRVGVRAAGERSMSRGDVLRVAVIGDSTAYTDAVGALLPDDPALWPNVVGDVLRTATGRSVDVTVWARPGTDALGAWQALTKDRHVMFDVVGPADVVILAVGSFDHAPAGLPPVLDVLLPHLRPARLRRMVRSTVRRSHPWVVRSRRARGVRTSPAEFARRYGRVLDQARGLTMDRAVVVALGPTSHRARHHGGRHPRREESERRQLALARAHGWQVVPVWEHVLPHAGGLNPDGVHWPTAAHLSVGQAVADAVLDGLARGPLSRPR